MDATSSLARRYGLAVAAVAVALLLELAVAPYTSPTPFKFLFGAVAVAAWRGGLGPGVLATALGAVLVNLVLIPPALAPAVQAADLAALATFIAVSLLICWISESLVEARRRAEAARLTAEAERRASDAAAVLVRALQAATAAFAAAVTPREVADVAVQSGRGLAGATGAVVALLTPDGSTFEVVSVAGSPVETSPDGRLIASTGPHPAAEAARRGEAVWVESPEDWAARFGGRVERADPAAQAWAYAPLTRDGRTVGALGLSFGQARSPAVTTEDGRAAILALAAQCTLALERAHLHESQRAALARAAFLAEAGAVLASSLDYETRLQSLARLAVPVLADWCVVDVLDEDGLIRRLAIAHADPAKEAAARRLQERYPALRADGAHTIARVLRDGRPWYDPAVDEERFVREARDAEHLALLRALGFASELVVPLVARGRALGTITLAFGREGGRWHTLDDLALAELLAGRAALAIDNAGLYAAAERDRERHAFLAEAARLLAGSLDETAVLQALARLAVPRLADWSAAYLADDRGALRRVAVAGPDPEAEAHVEAGMGPAMMTPAAADPLARALVTGEPVLVEQVTPDLVIAAARDDAHLAALHAIGLRSQVVAPLVVGGRALGLLSLLTAVSGRRLGPADAALAEEVAGRAALAVAHARLYAAERRAREAAQAAEARYRGLFEGLDAGIVVADAAGQFVEANPAAAVLLGYSREELLDLSVGDLGADDRAVSRELFAQVPRAGSWRGEIELRRKDGTVLPTESWQRAVDLPGGRAYMAVWRDITERRALERLRQEYMAMLGHDLKAPLAGVKAAAQLMQRRGEYRERSVAMIVGEVDRLARLVDDLLDAARLEAGRLELRRAAVDLVELAQAAAERAQATTEAHRVRVEAPDRPLVGQWDRDRLAQALGNLLSNAVKYSPGGGEILVTVAGHGGEALLTVRDQGEGIPPADVPRLFDRFFRAAGASAGETPGLGLGLYICKGLVEAHGGRLWVESEVGRGSAFTAALPRDPPPGTGTAGGG